MRKNYLIFSLLTLIGIMLTSCIKEEAIAQETDIKDASIQDAELFLSNPIPQITNNNIFFYLKEGIAVNEFAPIFQLSEGTTISPENGTKRDFSKGPQSYTITSNNGKYKKIYHVSFITSDFISKYSFENVETIITDSPNGIYNEFYEILPNNQKRFDWTSGNQGYNMLAETLMESEGVKELTPGFYPTSSWENGLKGKGIKMITKSTGPLGQLMGSPIAAGNLYIGTFNFTFPAINSTRFGMPYAKRTPMPVSLKGSFKYKAGEKFIVNDKSGSNYTKDTWDAYAIIFKDNKTTKNYLPGNHNFKDERMIAIARLSDEQRIEAINWTNFNIPFKLLEGKEFDPTADYMITIVFSSSIEGARFNGAVGSTLYIDEVELNFDNN